MAYITIGTIWIVVSTFYGALGMAIGPGAVMIFCGIILGLSGSIVHLLAYAYDVELKWYYAGFIISVVSILLTMMIIGGDTAKIEIIMFLWVFYAIPSYLIYVVIRLAPRLRNKLRVT